jgi:hypothetical protein
VQTQVWSQFMVHELVLDSSSQNTSLFPANSRSTGPVQYAYKQVSHSTGPVQYVYKPISKFHLLCEAQWTDPLIQACSIALILFQSLQDYCYDGQQTERNVCLCGGKYQQCISCVHFPISLSHTSSGVQHVMILALNMVTKTGHKWVTGPLLHRQCLSFMWICNTSVEAVALC